MNLYLFTFLLIRFFQAAMLPEYLQMWYLGIQWKPGMPLKMVESSSWVLGDILFRFQGSNTFGTRLIYFSKKYIPPKTNSKLAPQKMMGLEDDSIVFFNWSLFRGFNPVILGQLTSCNCRVLSWRSQSILFLMSQPWYYHLERIDG